MFPSPVPGQDATQTCSGKSTDLLIREPAPGHVRHEDLRPGGGLSRDGAERVAAEEHRTQNHHLAETRLDRKSDELKMKNGFSFVQWPRDERERKKEEVREREKKEEEREREKETGRKRERKRNRKEGDGERYRRKMKEEDRERKRERGSEGKRERKKKESGAAKEREEEKERASPLTLNCESSLNLSESFRVTFSH